MDHNEVILKQTNDGSFGSGSPRIALVYGAGRVGWPNWGNPQLALSLAAKTF